MSQAPNPIVSFKPGELAEPLEAMLRDRDQTRSDFYRDLTAAALALHERGEDPVSILRELPEGGIARLEEREAKVNQLAASSRAALIEMRNALAPVWTVMVEAGKTAKTDALVKPKDTSSEPNLNDVLSLCRDLVATSRELTNAYLTAIKL